MKRSSLLLMPRIACCVVAVIAGDVRGQALQSADDESQIIRAIGNLSAEKKYEGSSGCRRCHTSGLTEEDRLKGVGDRVCLTEALVWQKSDHHADAYASLSSSRGKRMQQLLSADVYKPETGCVQCHTTSLAAATWASEGVSCEACHGPSSGWLNEHYQFADWSDTPLDEKTDRGWIDVRSPVTRAELCVSCHVGSPSQGRVITHDMYAAGHPPLAGFELESFVDQMPRHWRHSLEKLNVSQPSFQRTRNLLVAAVVAMRMANELAMADAEAPNQTARWPEFARLDCFACHHELKSPGWRQIRSRAGSPGLPPLVIGCLPLVEVATATADRPQADQELNHLVKEMRTAFESNPFGDPAKVAKHGQSVGKWCRSIEQRLELMDLTPQQARNVLHRIAEQSAGEYRDYDTARQLLGSWLVIYTELDAHGELQLTDVQRSRVDEQLGLMKNQYPQLAERGQMTLACDAAPPKKRDYNQLLAQQYKNRIEFDPQRFKELMTELARLLPE